MDFNFEIIGRIAMRNLLLSTVSLFVVPAVAIAAPDFISHIHTTPIELKPISHSFGLKTAAICFLGVGDCDPNAGFGKGDENYTLDTSAQCKNEGFVANNCNSVQTPTGYCPYNKSYVSGCKCASNLITCPAGQVGVGDSCNGQYASCQCDPALISCPSNKNGQGASCGGKYQSCVCKSEYIYTSSNCTSPRSLSGSSCDGKYTGCSCPTGVSSGSYGCETYYPSPCSSVCKKAYTDNCHNRSDNNSAVYGCMKYWSDCSSKCETPYTDNCRNRTAVISSCPANANCQYFSDCSSKISSWSCKSGYIQSGNSCINPCDNRTNQSCSYGCQTYWSDCSSKCQTCYPDNCRNQTAVSVPSNATCSSYYSDCSSKCSAWSCNSGYEKSGNSCIKVDPCDNRTNQSCTYGCQTYWSDCSSKCQTCYPDNCRNRVAVNVPTNGYCSAHYSDCSSKCSDFACYSGYYKSGMQCIKDVKCIKWGYTYESTDYIAGPDDYVDNGTCTYWYDDGSSKTEWVSVRPSSEPFNSISDYCEYYCDY